MLPIALQTSLQRMLHFTCLASLLILPLGIQSQAYSPEFSTAGFYQTDASVREAIHFNIGWRFIKQDVDGAQAVDFDDRSWEIVNLPHGMELLPLVASGGLTSQGPSCYRNI